MGGETVANGGTGEGDTVANDGTGQGETVANGDTVANGGTGQGDTIANGGTGEGDTVDDDKLIRFCGTVAKAFPAAVTEEACLTAVAKAKDAPGWLKSTAATICVGLVGWTG